MTIKLKSSADESESLFKPKIDPVRI